MLITNCLISWNVYGSTKAPPCRGFSYIEIWIIGVQSVIFLAIIEYTCILALKRDFGLKWTEKFDSKLDEIIKKIDLWSLITSAILFAFFVLIYCSINVNTF